MWKPWYLLPPQVAHDYLPLALKCFAALPNKQNEWSPFQWKGLSFRNRLGIAGGLDKEASCIQEWWKLGAGFVEIGTVTLKEQTPNPGKILDRDAHILALWNKMGFPSPGSDTVLKNLIRLPQHQTPVFVNIGKNRDTPNASAFTDYVQLVQKFTSVADAFVVNVSSPNTKDLRQLQSPEAIEKLLSVVIASAHEEKPFLVKLSPDMSVSDLEKSLEACLKAGVHGFVLTNTTTSRDFANRFPTEGGVSGKPLAELSKNALKHTIQFLGSQRKDKLIVSVGGVMSPEDVFERIELGADLVQVYSALAFHGPRFLRTVAKAAR